MFRQFKNNQAELFMEISQIIDHILKNQTNVNALIVITALTFLALIGTFKSKNPKIRHFAKQSPAILATVGIFFSACFKSIKNSYELE